MTQEEPRVSGEQSVAAPVERSTSDAGAGAGQVVGSVAPGGGDEMSAVRDLILRAYPDVVPELVRGGTIGELQASIEPARAAYRQVAERITAAGPPVPAAPAPPSSSTGASVPPSVPAGAVAMPVSLDGLPASELIKRGLASTRRK